MEIARKECFLCKRELSVKQFRKKPESPDSLSSLCYRCLLLTNTPNYRGYQEQFTCRLCGMTKSSSHFYKDKKKHLFCSKCRKLPNTAARGAYYKMKREHPEALKIYQKLSKRNQRSKKTIDKIDLLIARIKPLMMECLQEYSSTFTNLCNSYPTIKDWIEQDASGYYKDRKACDCILFGIKYLLQNYPIEEIKDIFFNRIDEWWMSDREHDTPSEEEQIRPFAYSISDLIKLIALDERLCSKMDKLMIVPSKITR